MVEQKNLSDELRKRTEKQYDTEACRKARQEEETEKDDDMEIPYFVQNSI